MSTSFKISGNIGDVHASIPAMKKHFTDTGKKVVLYLVKDNPAEYHDGVGHPTKNESGQLVQLNEAMINMMMPLYKTFEFIEDVKIYNGEPIVFDLDNIRKTHVGMPNFSINRWCMRVYPELSCDTTVKWIDVPDSDKDLAKGKIVITRTERYQNPFINYEFLKPYEDNCIFIGTMREYNNFCMGFDLNIRKFNITNFLEEAQALKQCKFHISNQTQAFQLSQGLDIPRIVELCEFAPNVLVFGKGYDFLGQLELEYYFHLLNGSLNDFKEQMTKKPGYTRLDDGSHTVV